MKGREGIHLSKDRNKCQDFGSTGINLRVPQKLAKFLPRLGAASLSRKDFDV